MNTLSPHSTTRPLVWHELGPADQGRIEALHHQVIGKASPALIKPEAPEFFAALLAGQGRILGVSNSEGTLVAYGVLQHAPDPEDDLCRLLGWPRTTIIHKLAGASVAPGWRGQGLQRALIDARLALGKADTHFYATAAPINPVSWQNLLHSGFEIRALHKRYGGMLRYLLIREPYGHQAGSEFPANTLRIADTELDRQASLLAAGWRGVARTTPSGWTYVLVSGEQDRLP